jgi:hypothetical protein
MQDSNDVTKAVLFALALVISIDIFLIATHLWH